MHDPDTDGGLSPRHRHLTSLVVGGAVLGAVVSAILFGIFRGVGRIIPGAAVGAVLGVAISLTLLAAGAVLRVAFGEEPSLMRQTGLGAVVAAICGAVGQGTRGWMIGLAIGVCHGATLAAVGGVILKLLLRGRMVQEFRGQPSSHAPPVSRQVFRGSAVALRLIFAILGLAVANLLIILLLILTRLEGVDARIIAASSLGSLIEPSLVIPYVLSRSPRKSPGAPGVSE